MGDPNQLLPHEAEAVKLARSREFIGVSHVVAAALQRDLNDPAALRRLAALALVRARRIEAECGCSPHRAPGAYRHSVSCRFYDGPGKQPQGPKDGGHASWCRWGDHEGQSCAVARQRAGESLRRRVTEEWTWERLLVDLGFSPEAARIAARRGRDEQP